MAITRVTTDGITDSAVSTAKIGANAVDTTKIGADVMTGPLSSIKSLVNHPLTEIGLKKFLDDYKKGN